MRLFSKILSTGLAICLALTIIPVSTAWADEEITANTPWPDLEALYNSVDEASAAYDAASQRILELEEEIGALNQEILKIQSSLPEARKLSDEAAREYYRMFSTSNPFLEMLFGATSLTDFYAKYEYTRRANQSYLDNITSLSALNAELEEAKKKLETSKAKMEEEQLRAEEALLEAQSARDEAEETARLIAEATAAATAAAAAEAAAEEAARENPVSPSAPGVTSPESPTDKQAFVDMWTPRIDAYLAGSPLAGYGYAFANAAFDYNVDPRWSPAIAHLESSKGAICFLPHNAWGWGSVSWPDWETAIYDHVRGLSIGYGYTISESAAKKYCPPNWEYWYSFVSKQMNNI